MVTHTHTRTHARTHARTQARTPTLTHAHTHTHTHTHTHVVLLLLVFCLNFSVHIIIWTEIDRQTEGVEEKREKMKKVIAGALYLGLDNLKQSKSERKQKDLLPS